MADIPNYRQKTADNWLARGACVGNNEIFHNPDSFKREGKIAKRERETKAQQVCLSCPVIFECTREAIERGEKFGVWGGLTEGNRKIVFQKINAKRKTS